jgi:hypothetical protein
VLAPKPAVRLLAVLVVALAVSWPVTAGAVSPVAPDTIGLFRTNAPNGSNTFFLRNHNTVAAPANTLLGVGISPGDQRLVGDWDGDGIVTFGLVRSNVPVGSNTVYLWNTNTVGPPDVIIEGIGAVGDLFIVGDWDGNGTDTLGLMRPNSPAGSNTIVYWNTLTSPPPAPDGSISAIGEAGDVPFTGKWNGTGGTSIALLRPNVPAGSNSVFVWLTLPGTPPPGPDVTIGGLGVNGDVPLGGDWDGTGSDTLGLFRTDTPPGSTTFFLWNTVNLGLVPPAPDATVAGYGLSTDLPVVGHWGNSPPAIEPATFGIAENSANGTAVGTVTFSDPDNPAAGQTLTLSLQAGNTGNTFAIDGSTGQLTVANNTLLDFETHPQFTLTVRVTDNGTPVFFREATVTVNVTDVNEPPVITVPGGPLAYTEGDPATVIDGSLTVTDPDSATLTQATVQISANYQSGSDQLACPGGCNGLSANFAAGTLTLSNAASPATYQAALRTVTFQNTSSNPTATGATRTITWGATDGAATSNPVTTTINVTAVNNAPALTAGGTLSYTEAQAATAIDTTITVSDADSPSLTGATGQITGGCASGEDVLSFTTQNGITGTYTAASCLMTLTTACPTTASATRAGRRSQAWPSSSA